MIDAACASANKGANVHWPGTAPSVEMATVHSAGVRLGTTDSLRGHTLPAKASSRQSEERQALGNGRFVPISKPPSVATFEHPFCPT